MRRRGVTDFDTVQVDAWPAGHFGPEDETGQRLVTFRIVAFLVVQLRLFRELLAHLRALLLCVLHLIAHGSRSTRNAAREPSV